MRCITCGKEHELLDPIFLRPDIIFAMSAEEKNGRVVENDDICALRGDAGAPHRYFVRCTLTVALLDAPGICRWGFWAEVSEEDSNTIYRSWDDPSQDRIPPMQGRLANRVAGYPDTTSLTVTVKLIGPNTRPELSFAPDEHHPFADECLAGVTVHRVQEWLHTRPASAP